MKVVQIAPPWLPVPPPGYGGSELVAAWLTEGLMDKGLSVHLFCLDTSLNVPVGRFMPPRWPHPDKYSENRFLSHCTRQLPGMEVDLVHSHLETFAGFQRLIDHRWPVVVTLHIPVSEAMADYMSHFPEIHYCVPGGLQKKRLETSVPNLYRIPHGLPVEKYVFREKKDDYLLFLGRIMEAKGVDDAIRLAREVDLPLVIAGPVFEPDRDYFNRAIAPALESGRATHVGEVGFAEKNRLLSRALALVHPVRVEEAFGLILAEAMACGTPVLAYGRGAVREVVKDGHSGVVVESYEEMAGRFEELLAIKPADCRRHVERNFHLDQMVASYLDLYRSLI